MPTISPELVPTVSAGNLFERLTEDGTLNIRWITAKDPVYFEIQNRPIADVTLRQLIIAKTLDTLGLNLGRQSNFPFLITASVSDGTSEAEVPPAWIWDLSMSLPSKWENARLAKVKRLSGNNQGTITGTLRLIFTANVSGSTTETSIFYADYLIESNLTYQRARLSTVSSTEESNAIPSGETNTVDGFITFRTLDTADPTAEAFFLLLEPAATGTAEYEVVDTPAGGASETDDFQPTAMSHGTGLLVDSTFNPIPALDSDTGVWLDAFNYPFDLDASRTSAAPIAITIPKGIFREFDIAVPAGDEPTDDVSGEYFPVYITKIQRYGTGTDDLRFFFGTHNVTDDAQSNDIIEFATLDLNRNDTAGTIVEIAPVDDLFNKSGTGASLFQQHFGRGHVVLSDLWTGANAEIEAFFDAFDSILDDPVECTFTKASTRISSFGLSRVPKYIPTIGESQALKGTTSNRETPVYPSSDNQYVMQLDIGKGDQVNFATSDLLPVDKRENADIEAVAYKGSRVSQTVWLIVDAKGTAHDYDDDILPRLRCLFGRDPQFGDEWYDGTRFKKFNGDAWVG